MSLFIKAIAVCPQCGTKTEVEYAGSVNADRRPDLRLAIQNGTFQAESCAKCDARMRLPASLTYMDMRRGSWILVHGAEALEAWPDKEREALGVFDLAFGARAAKAAQDIGRELAPRLVFGWPALREKLLCADLSLDDTILELMKMAVLRNTPDTPIADELELRLIAGDDTYLELAWIISATEAPISTSQIPKEAYDGIADDLEPWRPLRDAVRGPMFVDMQRILMS